MKVSTRASDAIAAEDRDAGRWEAVCQFRPAFAYYAGGDS